MPRNIRHFGSAAMICLQAMIALTGNFCYFNILTIVICTLLFDDQIFERCGFNQIIVPITKQGIGCRISSSVRSLVCITIVFLSIVPTLSIVIHAHYMPSQLVKLTERMDVFRIANSYGLFSAMVTERENIVLEISQDLQQWHEFEFHSFPGALNRAPPWPAPWSPLSRLDLLLWFAPLGQQQNHPWLAPLMNKLLKGDTRFARFLSPGKTMSACAIRAVLYKYQFSSLNTTLWWERKRQRYLLFSVNQSFKECQTAEVTQMRSSWQARGLLTNQTQ